MMTMTRTKSMETSSHQTDELVSAQFVGDLSFFSDLVVALGTTGRSFVCLGFRFHSKVTLRVLRV